MYRLCIWKQALSLLLLVSLTISNAVFANTQSLNSNSLLIVTPSWKNFTEVDGSGFYFELMRKIYEPHGIDIDFQITPWARSVALVSLKQADALVGSYYDEPESFHYPKQAIWRDISSAVFKHKKVNWQGVNSLRNSNVGWIRGYSYNDYIDVPMNIIKLIDNKQAWTLLELNRIDIYIDSLTDLKLYIEENNIDLTTYQIENILSKSMFVRFAKTEKGERFANIFDKGIEELQQNGELKALYSKWGYEDLYTE